MPSSQIIRQQFIDFFADRCGHTHVPSSPVVPHDDPTLLFANAGMNQFKDVFLGLGNRPYTRATNTQKCIRAGGKHNDLDDVGKDTYHHTFFEMLGNWSFGDYFKEEAIGWAWELLTDVWGLDKHRLHATVFGGDEADNLQRDEETAELWRSVTDINPENIHFCGKKDNFWEMGETGPCGPCSEIHIDLTPDLSGRSRVNADDARVIEIWNLVFIQFNRDLQGKLTALPAQHVDTGMGLERLVAVLQGREHGYNKTNYDTDIFTTLFNAITQVTGARAYQGDPQTTLADPIDTAYRVIADHARCLTFALSDGASFGSNKRESVLRSVARRAARFGRQTLGTTEPFLHKLVPTLVEQMGQVFPELKSDPDRVAGMIEEEEQLFGKTIDRGISLFNEAAQNATEGVIGGNHAFDLESTYGFPFDMTEQMARERQLKIDTLGYEKAKQQHIEISRGEGGGDRASQSLIEFLQQNPMETTDFEGDQTLLSQVKILQLFQKNDGVYEPVAQLTQGHEAAIAVDRTPFYAESGGQVGDTGTIHSARGAVFAVCDTQKIGNVHFHFGQLTEGGLEAEQPPLDADDALVLEIDQPRRQAIAAHHTSTHLMNWALRQTLGDHVQQRGSLVDAAKTRFDFANPQPLTPQQIAEVEKQVNDRIQENLSIDTQWADQEQALEIEGLRAVFGEKYPPKVRVVSIGQPVDQLLKKPNKSDWRQYSVEFCGGTHLKQTDEAQAFAIVSEENVAKGVRRMTAIAGVQAQEAGEQAQTLEGRIDALQGQPPQSLQQDLAACQQTLQTTTLSLLDRHRLQEKLTGLHQVLKEHRKAADKNAQASVVDQARRIADDHSDRLIIASLEEADADALRKAMDVIRAKKPEAAMLLASASEEKVAFLASVPQALIAQGLKAGDWVREVAKVTGGGGGGRPDMAQAGGKNPAKLQDALERAQTFAAEFIS